MNKSYSKIRHILESNLILEKRRMILKEDVTGKKKPKYSETGSETALRHCNSAAVYGRKPKVEDNKLIFKVDALRSATIEFGDTVNGVGETGFITINIPEADMGTKNSDGTYTKFNMPHWSKFMGEPKLITTISGEKVYQFHKSYPTSTDLFREILGVTADMEGFNTSENCGTKCIPWGSRLPSLVCPPETTTTTTTAKPV
jgi:hypothetical protein